jgi:hypothetical protein
MKGRFSRLDGHPDKDLIDFQTSKIWRDYYRKSGYTHTSGSCQPTTDRNGSIKQEIQELWGRLLTLEAHSLLMESALRQILSILNEILESTDEDQKR